MTVTPSGPSKSESLDAQGVRPETTADKQRVMIEPHHVTALRGCRTVNGSQDRHSQLSNASAKAGPAATRNLSGLQITRPIGHQHGIVSVQGIKTGAVGREERTQFGFVINSTNR